MLADVTIDELGERELMRSLEDLLRAGEVDAACTRLRELAAPYCREGGPLPAALIEASAEDVVLEGWDELSARIAELDRDEHPVTAIGFEIGDPATVGMSPDDEGRLDPFVETCFYTDSAYPFSECDREALLEGYSTYGSEWQGSADYCDETVGVRGIHVLYGAVAALGARVAASGEEADEEEARAWRIGASLIAALIHAAVREAVADRGLPRPLAVFVSGNDSYPGFDAPVAAAIGGIAGAAVPARRALPVLPPACSEPDLPPPATSMAEEDEPAVETEIPQTALPAGFLELGAGDETAEDEEREKHEDETASVAPAAKTVDGYTFGAPDDEDDDGQGVTEQELAPAADDEFIDFAAIDWSDAPAEPEPEALTAWDEPAAGSALPAWDGNPTAAEDQPVGPDDRNEDIAWHLPPPGIHVTGSQLRRKFVTAESIAETQETAKQGLARRLLGRMRSRS